jgi:flagellar motor protein MotB
MSRKKNVAEDDKPQVPAYIVTFSDMVTLLLTFFVLLLAMADEQKVELFTAGQSAFKRALADFGLSGSLFSMHGGLDFGHPKAKYKVDEGRDEADDRSIDSQMEMLRRKLLDVERTMEILPSQIVCASKTFTVTDIHFERGSWSLNEPAKEFLRTYCRQLAESLGSEAVSVYVVGLAATERSERRQWLVSAHRAEAVADFIKESLGEQSNGSVYSWGAGAGGDWSGSSGVISKQTNIMIVALTASR